MKKPKPKPCQPRPVRVRVRVRLKQEQQRKLFAHHQAHVDMSLPQLCRWAAERFQLPKEPSVSSVSAILKKWRERAAGDGEPEDALSARVSHSLERQLVEWIAHCEKLGMRVLGVLIQSKAEQIRDALLAEEESDPSSHEKLRKLKFSNGWLYSFQLRHKLIVSSHNDDGEEDGSDAENERRERRDSDEEAEDDDDEEQQETNPVVVGREETGEEDYSANGSDSECKVSPIHTTSRVSYRRLLRGPASRAYRETCDLPDVAGIVDVVAPEVLAHGARVLALFVAVHFAEALVEDVAVSEALGVARFAHSEVGRALILARRVVCCLRCDTAEPAWCADERQQSAECQKSA